jgi:hypothetical protein
MFCDITPPSHEGFEFKHPFAKEASGVTGFQPILVTLRFFGNSYWPIKDRRTPTRMTGILHAL